VSGVRLVDAGTGRGSTAGGAYVTCRHLVRAGSQAERGLTPSGGSTAGAGITAVNGYIRRLL